MDCAHKAILVEQIYSSKVSDLLYALYDTDASSDFEQKNSAIGGGAKSLL